MTVPDFIRMKEPQFWEYNNGSKNEWKRTGEMKSQSCIISKTSRPEEKSKSKNTVDTVQQTKIARSAANYFSETSTEIPKTRQCSVSCFGPAQSCPISRNDATAEMGTDETQRASA